MMSVSVVVCCLWAVCHMWMNARVMSVSIVLLCEAVCLMWVNAWVMSVCVVIVVSMC